MAESKSSSRSRLSTDMPDLRALETFVAVCDASSMTLAAKRLGLSQSSISQSISALEKYFNLQLMDRDVRPARPTHAGLVLHQVSTQLLSTARAAMDQVRSAARQELDQIRLGCVDSFAATVGPALIRAMSGKARQIQMWSGLTPTLVEQLRTRELDMVVCTDADVQSMRVVQRQLFSEAWVAVYPKGHVLPDLTSFKLLASASGSLPLIRYSRRSVIGQQIERYLRHVGVHEPRTYEFDATDPLLSLVASGLGWALSTPLCLWQSRHHLDAVQVVALPPARLGRRQFFLLSREGEWRGQDEEVARLARAVIRSDIALAIHRCLPALPEGVLSCSDKISP